MSLTKRALWVIERHLDRDLSLGDLASACGVSPCHLSHAFAESVGQSVTQYMRARRLSFAADALASGAPDILDLALASGYGSHEAFSRAFKSRFGVTPEGVRRRGTSAGLSLVPAIDMMEAPRHFLPAPDVRNAPATSFACLSGRFALSAMQDVPALWQRFMSIYPDIDDKVDPIPVGVIGPIDEDGSLDYRCAVEVRATSGLPAELFILKLPPGRYAVFLHRGHVSTIRGTYDAIWNRSLPENGWTTPTEPSLERHDTGFDPSTGDGGVAIWIPIVEAQEAGGPSRSG